MHLFGMQTEVPGHIWPAAGHFLAKWVLCAVQSQRLWGATGMEQPTLDGDLLEEAFWGNGLCIGLVKGPPNRLSLKIDRHCLCKGTRSCLKSE